MNIYTKRLIDEWRKHGKLVIAIDFDSTIYPYHNLENQKDIDRAIELVQVAYAIGAYIVIFTASVPERFQFIQEYCDEKKIPVSAINKNPIDLPFGNSGKVYANIFLDDRAGFVEAMNILEEAINEIQKDKK